ncbi:hypothetical protein [Kordia sp.]|uniref:hypothetical protein n=1 Tax=Kordia sp. TaxID=1965332 RepID=UPI003B5992AA
MKKLVILFSILLFISCTYEKGDITSEMTTNLVSFHHKELNHRLSTNDSIANGTLHQKKTDHLLTIDYFTEETGCPSFEGGSIVIGDTLTLYYQDVNFQLVKCIGLYQLTYVIDTKNLDYKDIKVVRLKAIKKGISF